jgi:Fe-S-cluster-containing dehydrogenase component
MLMAAKWNLIVDVARCDNCRVCFLAVKDEYVGNEFPGYSAPQPAQGHKWLDIHRRERGSYPLVEARFMPVMCNHCDDAPCMKAARDGAVIKREDGVVIIDPLRSKGQKQIVDACPYGAVSWNEERQIPQAWIFDVHLLDAGWTKTRAEQACPMSVFRSIKATDEEMQRFVVAEGLEVRNPQFGTRPRVYYKNLHVMARCFVGGTVVHVVDGIEECAARVEVVLSRNGQEIGRTRTNTFGEFKIDRLEPHTDGYRLEAAGPQGRVACEFGLADESRYVGVLKLAA